MLNCTLSAGFLRWPNQGTDCPPEKPQKAVVPGRPGPKNEVFFFSFKGDFIFLQSALGDIAIASPRLLGVCSASRFRRSCMDPRTRGPWPPSTRWTSCPRHARALQNQGSLQKPKWPSAPVSLRALSPGSLDPTWQTETPIYTPKAALDRLGLLLYKPLSNWKVKFPCTNLRGWLLECSTAVPSSPSAPPQRATFGQWMPLRVI